jgi:hypothetical protein
MFTLLRATCLGFDDAKMERSFQQHRTSKVLDNMRPIVVYFWLPIGFMLHLAEFAFLNKMSQEDVIVFSARNIVLAAAFGLCITEWSPKIKYRIGSCVVWMSRINYFAIAYKQAQALDDDIFSMTTLVYVLSMSGLKTPTYIEYIVHSIFLASIRPVLLVQRWSEPKYKELFWHVVYQNCMLLSFGAYVAWKVQSDLRRKWLRLPKEASASSKMNHRQTHTNCSRFDSAQDSSLIQQVWPLFES